MREREAERESERERERERGLGRVGVGEERGEGKETGARQSEEARQTFIFVSSCSWYPFRSELSAEPFLFFSTLFRYCTSAHCLGMSMGNET